MLQRAYVWLRSKSAAENFVVDCAVFGLALVSTAVWAVWLAYEVVWRLLAWPSAF
jgi:hypothetical protein